MYVGITNSIRSRLAQHNSGKSRYTKAFMPWEVFYLENFPDYGQARKREKYLKAASGKKFLKQFIEQTLYAGSLPARRSQAGIPVGATLKTIKAL